MPKCEVCNEDHDLKSGKPMYIHSRCHPRSPIIALINNDAELTLICGEEGCDRPIVRFHVEGLQFPNSETTH